MCPTHAQGKGRLGTLTLPRICGTLSNLLTYLKWANTGTCHQGSL